MEERGCYGEQSTESRGKEELCAFDPEKLCTRLAHFSLSSILLDVIVDAIVVIIMRA